MRILLGLSGGLDSAYAAIKLKNEGHSVEGAVILMHEYTDVAAAEIVAREVGIPLHVVDCRERFKSVVVENFINEYVSGRTPNPCVICNSEVKFACLAEYARRGRFDAIATGHYARIVKSEDEGQTRYSFARSEDLTKDQTYMLYRLSQDIISMLVLPMGNEIKKIVRERASQAGLAVATARDSQEICFIPDGDYAEYIKSTVGEFKEGNFVDDEGRLLGRHKGIVHYTVGQRKGLGISLGYRAFVSRIDPLTNSITLSAEGSLRNRLSVTNIVFSGMVKPKKGTCLSCTVKLRYSAPCIPATVCFDEDTAIVELSTPARSITPGQSAVIYDGDRVLCGGFIDLPSAQIAGS